LGARFYTNDSCQYTVESNSNLGAVFSFFIFSILIYKHFDDFFTKMKHVLISTRRNRSIKEKKCTTTAPPHQKKHWLGAMPQLMSFLKPKSPYVTTNLTTG
jgi:uncharacterized membrane protein